MIRKVHVIYKTHLDIGFTDFSQEVKKRYFEVFIPKTIELAKKVNNNGKKNFIWTTGSWLIYSYLKESNGKNKKLMEEAIERGDIVWHGLPFTAHTELMNERLFKYGISYSKELDKRFKRKTIAAKMTDVPGHTKGMIKYMADSGLKYMHIGVNPASAVPLVPKIFKWSDGENEIILNYAKEYGEDVIIDGHDEVLVFAHSGDNCGPPSEETILKTIEDYKKKYADAEIFASTLDNFVDGLLKKNIDFPEICAEIGDTWIHGAASDPLKLKIYKNLLRCIDKWVVTKYLDESSELYRNIMDKIIMVPEHTWGMDIKLHFSDYLNYSKDNFEKAYLKDIVEDDATPKKYDFVQLFSIRNEEKLKLEGDIVKSYSKFEASWEEQREYLYSAIKLLPDNLQLQLKEEMLSEVNSESEKNEFTSLVEKKLSIGHYEVEISSEGFISSLYRGSKKISTGGFGKYIYRNIGEEEYEDWFSKYMINLEKNLKWCLPDQGKPGMEFLKEPIRTGIIHETELTNILINKQKNILILESKFKTRVHKDYILPESIKIIYHFKDETNISVEVKIEKIDKTRLPIEQWLVFNLENSGENINLIKLGSEVDPFNIVDKGNKNLHGIEKIKIDHSEITPLDSSLISLQGEKVLSFNKDNYIKNRFSFNLYNNVWGTNFPMWYKDDISARFNIKL